MPSGGVRFGTAFRGIIPPCHGLVFHAHGRAPNLTNLSSLNPPALSIHVDRQLDIQKQSHKHLITS